PGRHDAARGLQCPAAGGEPRGGGLRYHRDLRTPSPSLGSEQRLSSAAHVERYDAFGTVTGRFTGRDDRTARSPVVRGLPVPPRTQVAPESSPSALRSVHRCGGRPPLRRRRGARSERRRSSVRSFSLRSSPLLIAGPCAVESDDVMLRIATTLAEI